jgi:hypothetical protein
MAQSLASGKWPAAVGTCALERSTFIACRFRRFAGLSAAFLKRRINEEIEHGGAAFRISRACRADIGLRPAKDG